MKLTWEYIAGFFDGEGSLSRHSQNKNIWIISIAQNTANVLVKIKEFIGYGSIYYDSSGKNYKYQIFRRKEVADFVSQIAPFIIVKHEKIQEYKIQTKTL